MQVSSGVLGHGLCQLIDRLVAYTTKAAQETAKTEKLCAAFQA
jgi:hypothetical protein